MAATITSITGLQNLTNLTDFVADFNSLTSVDLSGMSNLIIVDISDNDVPDSNINSLTSVNLNGCTSIEELRLDDSNFSAGIPDISDLNSLTVIDLDQCGLVGSLDISYFPELTRFDVGGNTELTELIISSSQPLSFNTSLVADNCNFNQTAVDNILVTLADNDVTDGNINISNPDDIGTNAAPGAAGRAALFTLNSKNWNFSVANGNHTLLSLAYETTSGSICASTNIGGYYIASGSSLTIGNTIYTNSDAWDPAANGFYATGSAYYQVSGSGLIIATGSCS